MAEIIKTRTIRPSSRLKSSVLYKIDTSKITNKDILIVKINHESLPFEEEYKFSGHKVFDKKSIHFRVKSENIITWCGDINPD